jgi:preprotein translocase subunit SecA
MRSPALPIPGIVLGAYPERRLNALTTSRMLGAFLHPSLLVSRDLRRKFATLRVHTSALAASGNNAHGAFKDRVHELRAHLGRDGFSVELVAKSFALVSHAIEQRLGYRLFETQMYAAWIMLNNRLAEMATGEGKTIAACLAAATGALAGIPVHVITANDYLVQRDAELLRPVYETLGLSLGFVTQIMNEDQRRTAYSRDVTYCTAKELVFDYLRDGLGRRAHASDLHARAAQLGQDRHKKPVLRGLCMAVVDEADSILIDEARTPLILAQSISNHSQEQFYREALMLASELQPQLDYRLDRTHQVADLTEQGAATLERRSAALAGSWRDRRWRHEAITLALAVQHLFVRDKHYIVRDGKVILVDQTTGRAAPGRIFSRGIHQMLEIKEGCEVTGEQRTIAQITYQRFFPRYHRLCGMSGTLREAGSELRCIYGLSVSVVPLRQPSRRQTWPTRTYASAEAKWKAVVDRVGELHRVGRPILIGTDSVADSEELARRLANGGLVAQVLNARDDGQEAAIVARAGQPRAIMVTTNMAGRGTDIALSAGVAELGGLHVICCQRNSARRIDRQLQGRCARQGDPGSTETIVALDLSSAARSLAQGVIGLLVNPGRSTPLAPIVGRILLALPRRLEELRHQYERWQLLRRDTLMERQLSFVGRGE